METSARNIDERKKQSTADSFLKKKICLYICLFIHKNFWKDIQEFGKTFSSGELD